MATVCDIGPPSEQRIYAYSYANAIPCGLLRPHEVRHPVTTHEHPRRNPVLTDPLFSHQYGWDEALLFVVPITIAVVVVRRLEKRSKHNKEPESEESRDSTDET